jgi:peptidoglycan/xylan/chitin deacetylase (PgdA/CDA1 family)
VTRAAPPPLALTYHGVAELPLRRDPYGLFVRPRDLESQIRRLRSWGYSFVTFGELARRNAAGDARGLVALTFDDGLADNVHTLLPLLRACGATATVFVVSGWLDGRLHPSPPHAPLLSGDDVRALHAAGLEIGSHTVTHPDLSLLDFAGALAELETSKRELEALLDAPVQVLAYPFGSASDETAAASRAAGYRAACRTIGLGSWSNPFALPRQAIVNGSTLLSLRLKRDDRYEPLMRFRVARLVPAGRRVLRRLLGS